MQYIGCVSGDPSDGFDVYSGQAPAKQVHGLVCGKGAFKAVFAGFFVSAGLFHRLEYLGFIRAHSVRLRVVVALFRGKKPLPSLAPVLPQQRFHPPIVDIQYRAAFHSLAYTAAQESGGFAQAHNLCACGGNSHEKLRFGVVDFGRSYPIEPTIIVDDFVWFHFFLQVFVV